MLGRLTFNPLVHIDPWLSVLMPALLWFGSHGRFTFGGARPIPVNPRNYRQFKRGDIIVSAAGVMTNFVLTFVFAGLFVAFGLASRALPGLGGALDVIQRMMVWGIQLNLILCFFNLIPIPPLDGSHLFYYLLPPDLGLKYRSLQRFGFLPLLVLMLLFQPVVNFLLTPAWVILRFLLGMILPYAVGQGWDIFST
jgi:Zn-dependent protease